MQRKFLHSHGNLLLSGGVVISPFMAAQQKIGEGRTAKITRYMLDGTRCGMVQGRHAAWNWAYRIDVELLPEARIETVDMGRGLRDARRVASTKASIVQEMWPGGKSFVRGPHGGLSEVK